MKFTQNMYAHRLKRWKVKSIPKQHILNTIHFQYEYKWLGWKTVTSNCANKTYQLKRGPLRPIGKYWHYKKKVFRWQFFTIKVGYICQGMLLFIYVIYASVKKSLNLPWHLHMSMLFLFLPMIESLLVWHMSMFLSLLSRFHSTYVKIF